MQKILLNGLPYEDIRLKYIGTTVINGNTGEIYYLNDLSEEEEVYNEVTDMYEMSSSYILVKPLEVIKEDTPIPEVKIRESYLSVELDMINFYSPTISSRWCNIGNTSVYLQLLSLQQYKKGLSAHRFKPILPENCMRNTSPAKDFNNALIQEKVKSSAMWTYYYIQQEIEGYPAFETVHKTFMEEQNKVMIRAFSHDYALINSPNYNELILYFGTTAIGVVKEDGTVLLDTLYKRIGEHLVQYVGDIQYAS